MKALQKWIDKKKTQDEGAIKTYSWNLHKMRQTF